MFYRTAPLLMTLNDLQNHISYSKCFFIHNILEDKPHKLTRMQLLTNEEQMTCHLYCQCYRITSTVVSELRNCSRYLPSCKLLNHKIVVLSHVQKKVQILQYDYCEPTTGSCIALSTDTIVDNFERLLKFISTFVDQSLRIMEYTIHQQNSALTEINVVTLTVCSRSLEVNTERRKFSRKCTNTIR